MRKLALPLATLEAVAGVEDRTKRMLERLNPATISVPKLGAILIACAIETLDKEAEYYRSCGVVKLSSLLKESATRRAVAAFALLEKTEFSLALDIYGSLSEELLRATAEHARSEARKARPSIGFSVPQAKAKRRRFLEPNLELLKNPDDSTLNRPNTAEALGITPRTLDRWITDERITPVGPSNRKRFKVKDIKRLLNQKVSRKRSHN
jgi:hypothetical protein